MPDRRQATAPAAKRATLADVASLAGVSPMTVSRVVRGQSAVSEATREQVRSAMASLHYRPNQLARSLVQGSSQTLGVVAFDYAQYGPGAALLGIERAARSRGFGVTVVAADGRDAASVRRGVLALADRAVDAVIVIAPFTSAAGALAGLPTARPIVVTQGGHAGHASLVAVDHVAGARLATAHLLALGHRTVHHVEGPPDWVESDLRRDGWRRELTERRRPVPPTLAGDWSARSGFENGARLAADPDVSAIFVANDQMAVGVLHSLHEVGRRVPGDVSVVGFDDVPEAEFLIPPLTTVRQDFDALGESAVDVATGLIADLDADPAARLLVPQLVVRSSTGPR